MGLLVESSQLLRTACPERGMDHPAPLGHWVTPTVASGEVGGGLPEVRGTTCRLGQESVSRKAGSGLTVPAVDASLGIYSTNKQILKF